MTDVKTILLVDDSRVAREVIKVFLAGRRIRILEAADGAHALRMMHEYRPALVLTDLEMPEMDGLGLSVRVKADPWLHDTPMIVLSGAVTPELARRCRAAGVREILEKPILPAQLLAAIDRHLPIGLAEHSMRL